MERSARGQAVVLGVVLILTGVVYIAIELIPRLAQIDFGHYGWPLFVLVPGVALIGVASAVPEVSALCVPGAVVITAGLVLFVQNVFGLFATTTYAWALVTPGSVGLGMWLQGAVEPAVEQADELRRRGTRALGTGLVIFLVSALFFETLHVSGVVFPLPVRLLVGLTIIVVGIVVVTRR
jgi:hypothetical protein